jgi:hypothetical protein
MAGDILGLPSYPTNRKRQPGVSPHCSDNPIVITMPIPFLWRK